MEPLETLLKQVIDTLQTMKVVAPPGTKSVTLKVAKITKMELIGYYHQYLLLITTTTTTTVTATTTTIIIIIDIYCYTTCSAGLNDFESYRGI